MKVHEALNLYKLHNNPQSLAKHDQVQQVVSQLHWVKLDIQEVHDGMSFAKITQGTGHTDLPPHAFSSCFDTKEQLVTYVRVHIARSLKDFSQLPGQPTIQEFVRKFGDLCKQINAEYLIESDNYDHGMIKVGCSGSFQMMDLIFPELSMAGGE